MTQVQVSTVEAAIERALDKVVGWSQPVRRAKAELVLRALVSEVQQAEREEWCAAIWPVNPELFRLLLAWAVAWAVIVIAAVVTVALLKLVVG